MINRLILLLMAILLNSCSFFDIFDPELEVLQMDAEYSDVFLFDNGRHIVGIDKQSHEKKIDLKFNTFVSYGDTSPDGRLFVGDSGKSVGIFGEQLFVIDNQGKMTKKIPVLPNPIIVRVIDNYIYADSGGYYTTGHTAYNLFDLNTYENLITDKTLNNSEANRNTWTYEDSIYLGVNPRSEMDWNSYFIKINKNTLEQTKVFSFTKNYPQHIFYCCIYNNYLYLLYRDSRIIELYDIDNMGLKASINLNEYYEELENEEDFDLFPANFGSDYKISDPFIVDSSLMVYLSDSTPELNFHHLVFLDKETLALRKDVKLSNESNRLLGYCSLTYVSGGQAYFDNSPTLIIYDINTGNCVKEVDLDE